MRERKEKILKAILSQVEHYLNWRNFSLIEKIFSGQIEKRAREDDARPMYELRHESTQ